MKKYLLILVSLIMTLMIVGCDRESGTLGGGAVGTAFGAAMGNAMGGGSAGGTALGAVIGGLTGAAIGNDIGAEEERMRDSGYYEPVCEPEPVCAPKPKVVYYETVRPQAVFKERVVYRDNDKMYERKLREKERRIRRLEKDLRYERNMNYCEPEPMCCPPPPPPVYCETYCAF